MAAYEIALHIDDEWTSSSISQCRICHEEEDEGDCKSLEAPCACSGTLKFAHRECIQRWCDEKGNTTCEICLEKYEPGYTAIPPPPIKKTRLADIAVTIRESLEVPRQNGELNNNRRLLEDAGAEDEILDTNYAESPSASERSVSFYRSIAMIFTTLLLMRHLISEITGVPDHYPFTLIALLILRAGGIAIPLYIMMQTIEMIQQWRQEQRQLHEADSSPLGEDEDEDEDELMP
ncbi:hypothetical protein AAC387_Pa10g1933 [Persea americana]